MFWARGAGAPARLIRVSMYRDDIDWGAQAGKPLGDWERVEAAICLVRSLYRRRGIDPFGDIDHLPWIHGRAVVGLTMEELYLATEQRLNTLYPLSRGERVVDPGGHYWVRVDGRRYYIHTTPPTPPFE